MQKRLQFYAAEISHQVFAFRILDCVHFFIHVAIFFI
jgi:hypothetical protein